ncbi:hypothetical protein ACRAWD_09375 [Caulobacter segnis]
MTTQTLGKHRAEGPLRDRRDPAGLPRARKTCTPGASARSTPRQALDRRAGRGGPTWEIGGDGGAGPGDGRRGRIPTASGPPWASRSARWTATSNPITSPAPTPRASSGRWAAR